MNTLKIYQDEDAENPRTAWDNLGTFAYKHSRYRLGEEKISEPIEWLEEKLGLQNQYEYSNERLEELEQKFYAKFVAEPVYLYDHSSLALSTTPFGCNWDSGKVGYIYVERCKIREEYGWKRITKAREEQIVKYLQGEIETQNQYVSGDVYYFVIEDEDGDIVDSCGGFYGDDWEANGIKDCIPEELYPQLEDIEIEY